MPRCRPARSAVARPGRLARPVAPPREQRRVDRHQPSRPAPGTGRDLAASARAAKAGRGPADRIPWRGARCGRRCGCRLLLYGVLASWSPPPGSSPSGRCRLPTRCGLRRRGARYVRPGSGSSAPTESGDQVGFSSRSCSTRARRCPTSRSGTQPSARAPLPRRRPVSGLLAVQPPGLRPALLVVSRDLAALKLLVAALGAYGLGWALGMRSGRRPAGRAGVRLQPLDGRVAVVADDEHLGAHAVAVAPVATGSCGGRTRCRRRARGGVGLQFLGGHPESSFHVVVATCCFLALRLIVMRPRRGAGPRWVARRVVAFVVAGAARRRAGGADAPAPGRAAGALGRRVRRGRRSVTCSRLGATCSVSSSATGGVGRRAPRSSSDDSWPGTPHTSGRFRSCSGSSALVRPRAERVGVAVIGAAALAISVGTPLIFGLVHSLPASTCRRTPGSSSCSSCARPCWPAGGSTTSP